VAQTIQQVTVSNSANSHHTFFGFI